MGKKQAATFSHTLYQPYKWLILSPLCLVSTLFYGSLAILLVGLKLPKAANVMPMLWARTIALVTPAQVHVSGRENIDPRQSYVITANHLSYFDIIAIYGWLGIDFRWVMKQELMKVPVLGYACKVLGHVFIDRSNRESAIDSINAARSRLKNGTSIFFFPEGTRSRDGRIQPFKKGAFRLAQELKLPILPITMSGSQHICPARTLDVMPGTINVTIHKPIAASNDLQVSELATQARDAIISSLPRQNGDSPSTSTSRTGKS